MEGAGTQADIVFGLNTDMTARARASGLFAPHGQDTSDLSLPIAWEDDIFLPYNWGETAFVYDSTRLENPPASFAELLEAEDSASSSRTRAVRCRVWRCCCGSSRSMR